jgi:RNA polymerase sigma-70 factor, ECF subfamily
MKADSAKQNASSLKMDKLAELFTAYQAFVYRSAYLILGTREEAEDALQDIFLKIHRSFESYDPAKGALSTWIYRVTVNHCLKRKTRYLWRFLPLESHRELQPGQTVAGFEEDQELLEALAHMTADQRVLVVLRYAWQCPYEEIAQIMGMPLGTVKSRHTRMLKLLKDYYERIEKQPSVEEKIE